MLQKEMREGISLTHSEEKELVEFPPSLLLDLSPPEDPFRKGGDENGMTLVRSQMKEITPYRKVFKLTNILIYRLEIE
jgi:hypothetical protein